MSGSTLNFSCVILPVYVHKKNKLGSFALAREGAHIPLVVSNIWTILIDLSIVLHDLAYKLPLAISYGTFKNGNSQTPHDLLR
jgi:hypothetical protein